MRKILILLLPILFLSCNKIKDTAWYCEDNGNTCKIEFLTDNKGVITETGNYNNNTIPFSYVIKNSNIEITITTATGHTFLYDIATLDEENNGLKLRRYFNGKYFTKTK